MIGYYYLHTNGTLHYKNKIVVDMDPLYFDSPFVKKVWKIDTTNRADAWRLVLEAAEWGADEKELKRLYKEWTLNKVDALGLAKHTGVRVEQDENGIWRKNSICLNKK